MNEISQFWSKVAKKYDVVVDLQIGPGTRSQVRERLAVENHLGSTVEFACGTGFFTPTLADKASSVLATDLSPGMLEVARERTKAPNAKFQLADCQKTSLPDAAFDTAFMSLLLHFVDPTQTLTEMHRILKPGGALIIANLDFDELQGFSRVRCRARVIFQGLLRYRTKPPKGLFKQVVSAKELCDLLAKVGFKVAAVETIKDPARSSYIPVEYIKAVKT